MSTKVTVAKLPVCDIHKYGTGEIHEAKYDGQTIAGVWGYMCEEAFQEFGVGLGTGRGQELVLE